MSRSKIHKCLSHEVEDEENVTSNYIHTLDSLPPEILEMIFKNLTYDEISKTIRLVSRQFQTIATLLLNNAFLAAGIKLKSVEKYLTEKIVIFKGEVNALHYHRMHNAMELIKTQYQLLKAVTWRYTHPIQNQKFVRLCFYAGSLLDILFKFLEILESKSCNLNFLFEAKHITSFEGICKQFMYHFEKVSERKVNKSALVSGCKVIDILDCLIEGREVKAFRICANRGQKPGKVCMEIKYVIKRAWFTCLEVANVANEHSWRDKQKFMYLRLRRLVGSVNIHLYENKHFKTELQLHIPQAPLPRPPMASTYSGYGEYGGYFFSYGNMNKFAYENKFKIAFSNNWADWENDEESSMQEDENKNNFDLVIVAKIRCSSELAPLAVKPLLYSDDFDEIIPSPDKKLELDLKLHVTCPASLTNRLPGKFTWEVSAPRKGRH